MADHLYAFCAFAAWIAVAYRMREVFRDPHNLALRALFATLVCIAASVTLAGRPVMILLDGAVGRPNLTILAAQVSCVLFSANAQRLLLYWSYPPAVARRLARRLLVPLLVLTLAAMVTLFLLAPLEETAPSLAQRYARYPYVTPYLLVYLSACIVGEVAIMRLGIRYARMPIRPWLRRGLRLVVAGAAAGLGFCLCKLAYVLGIWLGVELRPVEAVTPLLAGLFVLLLMVGLTLPGWGPRLSTAARLAGSYRAYRRLAPLWWALYRAEPQIALVPPSVYREWTIADLGFRLYRRVIEIRDGRLALRPFLSADTAARAASTGRAVGWQGARLDTFVEAVVLSAALRAHREGRPVRPDQALNADPRGSTAAGTDLASELAWWVPVATDFVAVTTPAA
jgi:hypothetical protein